MKLCVFITGTNGSGKTTAAKELQQHFGGIAYEEGGVSFCADRRAAFAGRYNSGKFGGVDSLGNTKCLRGVVETALKKSDIIFCEGSYLHTFGNNLTAAAFAADRQLIVTLYADAGTLNARLGQRSGRRLNKNIWNKQKTVLSSAKKWASIGVPVLAFNSGENKAQDIAAAILTQIKKMTDEEL